MKMDGVAGDQSARGSARDRIAHPRLGGKTAVLQQHLVGSLRSGEIQAALLTRESGLFIGPDCGTFITFARILRG